MTWTYQFFPPPFFFLFPCPPAKPCGRSNAAVLRWQESVPAHRGPRCCLRGVQSGGKCQTFHSLLFCCALTGWGKGEGHSNVPMMLSVFLAAEQTALKCLERVMFMLESYEITFMRHAFWLKLKFLYGSIRKVYLMYKSSTVMFFLVSFAVLLSWFTSTSYTSSKLVSQLQETSHLLRKLWMCFSHQRPRQTFLLLCR